MLLGRCNFLLKWSPFQVTGDILIFGTTVFNSVPKNADFSYQETYRYLCGTKRWNAPPTARSHSWGSGAKFVKKSIHQQFGRSSWWLSHPLLNCWMFRQIGSFLQGCGVCFSKNLWNQHLWYLVIPCIASVKTKHVLFPHHPPTTLPPPPKKKKRSNALLASFFWLGFQWMEVQLPPMAVRDRNGVLWLIRSYSANFSMVFWASIRSWTLGLDELLEFFCSR